jgi:hypothetical protein
MFMSRCVSHTNNHPRKLLERDFFIAKIAYPPATKCEKERRMRRKKLKSFLVQVATTIGMRLKDFDSIC